MSYLTFIIWRLSAGGHREARCEMYAPDLATAFMLARARWHGTSATLECEGTAR